MNPKKNKLDNEGCKSPQCQLLVFTVKRLHGAMPAETEHNNQRWLNFVYIIAQTDQSHPCLYALFKLPPKSLMINKSINKIQN